MTLDAWCRNFFTVWDTIRKQTDERFVRRWWLWLNGSQARFLTGRLMLWQILMTHGKRAEQPLTRRTWIAPRPDLGVD